MFSDSETDADGDRDEEVRHAKPKSSVISSVWFYCKKIVSYLCFWIYLPLMGSIILEKWCLSGKSRNNTMTMNSNSNSVASGMNGVHYERRGRAEYNLRNRYDSSSYSNNVNMNHVSSNSSSQSSQKSNRSSLVFFANFSKNANAKNNHSSHASSRASHYAGGDGRETTWMLDQFRTKTATVRTEKSWYKRLFGCLQKYWILEIGWLLLLTILIIYLLWMYGGYVKSYARPGIDGVSSYVGGALPMLSSVLNYFSFAQTARNSLEQGDKAAKPLVQTVPTSSVIVENVVSLDELNALKKESEATRASLKLARESIDALKLKIGAMEETLASHDSKLNVHDSSILNLEAEIGKIVSAMKAASAKEKTMEQILNEVLNVQVGETTEGEAVTLKSMFSVLQEKDDLKRISLEIEDKLRSLSLDITKIQGNSDNANDHLSNFKTDLNDLNARFSRMESVVDEQRSATVEVEMDVEKVKQVVLPILTQEIQKRVAISCESRVCPEGSLYHGLSIEDVELMIKRAISKYDADKTGLPDLALESAGGSILSTRCTKSSELRNSVISYWGFRLWSPPNTPRTIIQPGVVPGECWAFEGSVGDVVIKLAVPAVVTGFTLEHIPKTISRYGHIDSAPKHFQVLGLVSEHDTEDVHDYGTFTYEDNDEPLQYFPVNNATTRPYPIVELKVLSNHGNMKHTCIYRFRVHGAIDLSRSHGYSKSKPVDEAVTRK